MRYEACVTSISWIPSEAVRGMTRLPFGMGVAHDDEPPPDVLHDLDALRAADRFRFANELRAWIEVEDGRVVDSGYGGGGRTGATTISVAGRRMTFTAVPLPNLQQAPVLERNAVRFVQTAGSSSSSTACSKWRWAAKRSPRSVPARCSVNAQRSRAAAAPRRCAR
jgi:hypothetical protein